MQFVINFDFLNLKLVKNYIGLILNNVYLEYFILINKLFIIIITNFNKEIKRRKTS